MLPQNERSPVERALPFCVSAQADARFWCRVDREPGSDGCRPWRGSRSTKGYGLFRLMPCGPRIAAHRYAFASSNGPIPAGKIVCHRCDNPPCCNPDHLFAGTMSENTRDALAKGRFPQTHSVIRLRKSRRLDAGRVAELRQLAAAGWTGEGLGRRFGVDGGTARCIIRGETWRE